MGTPAAEGDTVQGVFHGRPALGLEGERVTRGVCVAPQSPRQQVHPPPAPESPRRELEARLNRAFEQAGAPGPDWPALV